MEEKDLRELAVEAAKIDSRSRSNEKRLNNNEAAIEELRKKQDAIYELTASVKSIAIDMSYVKEDIQDVKKSQQLLTNKVTEIENKPAVDIKTHADNLKYSILSMIAGGLVAWLFLSATGIVL